MVGAVIALSTRSGTLVARGFGRKYLPLWYVISMSFPQAEARGAAAKIQGAELAAALRRAVGGEVRFDSYTRYLFSRDASMYSIEPIGVVFPRDAADVAAVVTTACEFAGPGLPRGARTSP